MLVSTALMVADWGTARTRDIVDPITHEPTLSLLTRLSRAVRDTVQAAQQRADVAYPEGCESSDDEMDELWRSTVVQDRTSQAAHGRVCCGRTCRLSALAARGIATWRRRRLPAITHRKSGSPSHQGGPLV
ncbi:hypothetical protein [Streptomyces sp. Rer75]|uniref:hypothetical protein n=1 Tax=unclassified Streptomyces TaxID=2593676 RepID=UPI0015D09FD0|nr:hypothetical protein [Streptomyces sp. Rer75]QLH19467.1 hypothetical protein HYQ63_01390 [Streptomyces sp. Rer75]